jgi:hypothetical protein
MELTSTECRQLLEVLLRAPALPKGDDALLHMDLGYMIRHISEHNSFDKADLIELLKRAQRRIEGK